MWKLVTFLVGFFISGACGATPAVVDYIFDGDTLAADIAVADGVIINARVRLINIDAPELHGGCEYEINLARRATERLAALAPVGASVELANIKDDKYLGRIDANVILPDGRDLGDVLVADGLARYYSGGRRVSWCE